MAVTSRRVSRCATLLCQSPQEAVSRSMASGAPDCDASCAPPSRARTSPRHARPVMRCGSPYAKMLLHSPRLLRGSMISSENLHQPIRKAMSMHNAEHILLAVHDSEAGKTYAVEQALLKLQGLLEYFTGHSPNRARPALSLLTTASRQSSSSGGAASAFVGPSAPQPDDLRTIATFSARMRQMARTICGTFCLRYALRDALRARGDTPSSARYTGGAPGSRRTYCRDIHRNPRGGSTRKVRVGASATVPPFSTLIYGEQSL